MEGVGSGEMGGILLESKIPINCFDGFVGISYNTIYLDIVVRLIKMNAVDCKGLHYIIYIWIVRGEQLLKPFRANELHSPESAHFE